MAMDIHEGAWVRDVHENASFGVVMSIEGGNYRVRWGVGLESNESGNALQRSSAIDYLNHIRKIGREQANIDDVAMTAILQELGSGNAGPFSLDVLSKLEERVLGLATPQVSEPDVAFESIEQAAAESEDFDIFSQLDGEQEEEKTGESGVEALPDRVSCWCNFETKHVKLTRNGLEKKLTYNQFEKLIALFQKTEFVPELVEFMTSIQARFPKKGDTSYVGGYSIDYEEQRLPVNMFMEIDNFVLQAKEREKAIKARGGKVESVTVPNSTIFRPGDIVTVATETGKVHAIVNFYREDGTFNLSRGETNIVAEGSALGKSSLKAFYDDVNALSQEVRNIALSDFNPGAHSFNLLLELESSYLQSKAEIAKLEVFGEELAPSKAYHIAVTPDAIIWGIGETLKDCEADAQKVWEEHYKRPAETGELHYIPASRALYTATARGDGTTKWEMVDGIAVLAVNQSKTEPQAEQESEPVRTDAGLIDPETGEVIEASFILKKLGWTEVPTLGPEPTAEEIEKFAQALDQVVDRALGHRERAARYRAACEARCKSIDDTANFWTNEFVIPMAKILAPHRLPRTQKGGYRSKTLNLESGCIKFTKKGGAYVHDAALVKEFLNKSGVEKYTTIGAKREVVYDHRKLVSALNKGALKDIPGTGIKPPDELAEVKLAMPGAIQQEETDE